MLLEDNLDNSYIQFRDQTRFWIQRVAVPLISIVGLFGNLITIVIMTRRGMRSTTNLYLAALAFVDMLYLILTFLLGLSHYPNMAEYKYYAYWKLKPFLMMLTDACSNTSVWLTVTFTIERYIAVRYPMRGKVWCTEARAKMLILFVFWFGITFALPVPFEWKVIEKRSPTSTSQASINPYSNPMNISTSSDLKLTIEQPIATSTEITNEHISLALDYSDFGKNIIYKTVYYRLLAIIFSFIPLFSLILFNACLIKSVHESRKERQKMTGNTSEPNTTSASVTITNTHSSSKHGGDGDGNGDGDEHLIAAPISCHTVDAGSLTGSSIMYDEKANQASSANVSELQAAEPATESNTNPESLSSLNQNQPTNLMQNLPDTASNRSKIWLPNQLSQTTPELEVHSDPERRPDELRRVGQAARTHAQLGPKVASNLSLKVSISRESPVAKFGWRKTRPKANDCTSNAYHIISSPKKGLKDNPNQQAASSQERRITIMLISVVILFLVCQIPTAAMLIYESVHDVQANTNEQFLMLAFGNIFNFLMAVNAACNFILYSLLSKKYRRTFVVLFCGCLGAKSKPQDQTFAQQQQQHQHQQQQQHQHQQSRRPIMRLEFAIEDSAKKIPAKNLSTRDGGMMLTQV